ncbi:MAG: 2Fe-2S iron-sulfur cluster binding domain-containing protein [Hyphomicrobiaceae bacterium]|nr:2Fe-2S iron-sulfur cluster binding domain-containing protein [Hyphomicrobiaceae bacterium]
MTERRDGADHGADDASEDDTFELELVWSDVVLTVPAGRSALDVLAAAGVAIEAGCGHGSCGTCATEFVEGEVIHRDTCLSVADREHEFCPCISRGRGRIILPL